MRHTGFPGFSTAQTEEQGREIVIGTATIGSVQVTRKVYVPADQSFARFLEIVHNPGTSTISYTVPIYTNLGSDGNEPYRMTSSGDATVTTADNWVVTDDTAAGGTSGPPNAPTSDPVVTHVVAGEGGDLRPASFVYTGGQINYSYNLTLAPGETQIVMHFAGQAPDQPTAVTRAAQLAALELEALYGMSALERSQVVNFVAGDLDTFRFEANTGDPLVIETSTPGDAAGQPDNALDIDLVLYGPDGEEIPSGDYTETSPDGRNVHIEYTAPETGTYRVEVRSADAGSGAYVLTVAGSTAAPPAFTATAVDPADGALLTVYPTTFTLDLSEALLLTSVDAADLTVDGVAATSVTVVDQDTLRFDIAGTAQGDGVYSVQIAEGALTSLSGKALSAFSASFDFDATAPWVTASSVVDGEILAPGSLTYYASFSETLATSGLGADDVLLVNLDTAEALTVQVSYDPGTGILAADLGNLAEGRKR
jgi:hypothetical protein